MVSRLPGKLKPGFFNLFANSLRNTRNKTNSITDPLSGFSQLDGLVTTII